MDGSDEITGYEDIIDSREVIARIEWLNPWHVEDDRRPLDSYGLGRDVAEFKTEDEAREYIADQPEEDRPHLAAFEDDAEATELKALQELAEESEGSADWRYGETLIADSYFEDYARELAEDIGAIDREAGWPATCIDWEEAADQLKVDYFSVEYKGMTFWIRS